MLQHQLARRFEAAASAAAPGEGGSKDKGRGGSSIGARLAGVLSLPSAAGKKRRVVQGVSAPLAVGACTTTPLSPTTKTNEMYLA